MSDHHEARTIETTLDLTPEQIENAREEFDSQKAILKAKLNSAEEPAT
jgi:hypothetical protein